MRADCGTPLTEKAKQKVDDTAIQVHQLFAENPEAQAIFPEV
jgi:hypothetical protein